MNNYYEFSLLFSDLAIEIYKISKNDIFNLKIFNYEKSTFFITYCSNTIIIEFL